MIFNSKMFRFIVFCLSICTIELKGQVFVELDTTQTVVLKNASFENAPGASKYPDFWDACTEGKAEVNPDVQPGSFGVQLVPLNGRTYLSMVGNDDGTSESIKQSLDEPLMAGKCYRLSVYLAKSEKYQNQSHLNSTLTLYDKPLKLILWGLPSDTCILNPDDWLAETKPVHHNRWKKYVFYIQPPRDCRALVFQVAHVVDKPYNGNILIDNISPILPVQCSDLKLSAGTVPSSRSAFLLIQLINEVILNNTSRLKFERKKAVFTYDGYSKKDETNSKSADKPIVRNEYFDRIIELFEKYNNYKIIIRVKNKDGLSKKRVVYLYNYIFQHSNIKAQQLDIQRFKPKDEEYVWSFENDELAISFDTL